jgi:hypothetical protein
VEEALVFTDRNGCDVILDMVSPPVCCIAQPVILTAFCQVAGEYIARDIACAAPDARIVIIATQVRRDISPLLPHSQPSYLQVLSPQSHVPVSSSSLCAPPFNPLQGGAASTVDCAAICRKRIVITGSLLRPQSQQQKAEQPPNCIHH